MKTEAKNYTKLYTCRPIEYTSEDSQKLAYAMSPEEIRELISLQNDEKKFHVFFCEMCEKYKDAISFE